jgi:hypothetical protein
MSSLFSKYDYLHRLFFLIKPIKISLILSLLIFGGNSVCIIIYKYQVIRSS